MKLFDYITREYVPSIDLNTLGQTYNTLEQGHKEAVKAASDLEVTMANLDLNEAESEWRQNKINEIRQTVADNTIYGNSYAALDDIITKAGDIASDQGMIGRLQAQKDYKAFRERVENDKTLPQDYKDYYLENNPYYYKDTYDKNGNIIGGTKWNPKTSPTNVIPLSQLVVQGISIAAKESGGGTMTRWLDVNGNVTTDPSKAVDGQVYNSTTNQWERLSKEKIWQGINSMIASTPGAIESIKQDYDVARWRHDKQLSANNGKPFESDVTDANGIYLSEEQYLHKRVDSAVQAASYYNAINKTTYGAGLASYRGAQSRAAGTGLLDNMLKDMGNMSSRNTPVEIDVDPATEFTTTKNISKNAIEELYKQLTGKDINLDKDNIEDIEKSLNGYDVPIDERQQLGANIKAYKEAQANLDAYTANMSDEDKAKFDFAARMKSGGKLVSSANGGSEYDDKLINLRNGAFGENGQTYIITLDNETLQYVDDIINGGGYDNYKELGIERNGNKIIIPKDAGNSLPMVASIVCKAESRANLGFRPSMKQWFSNQTNRLTIDVLDKNGNSIYPKKDETDYYPSFGGVKAVRESQTRHSSNVMSLRNMANIYDNGVNEANKLTDKYGVAPTKITVESLNLDGTHFNDMILIDQYEKGLITGEQYTKYKERFDKLFENEVKTADFSQTKMYVAEETGTRKLVESSEDRFNYGAEIHQAIKDKRVTITPTFVAGSSDPITGLPLGYNITVIPKTDDKGKPRGKEKTFYIPSLTNSTAAKYIMQSPKMQALNTIMVTGKTKSTRILTDANSNPRLGKVSITGLGNNMFQVQFNGINKTLELDDAVALTTAIYDYNACKNTFLSSGENEINARLRNTMFDSAQKISTALGIDANAVIDRFIDDINK